MSNRIKVTLTQHDIKTVDVSVEVNDNLISQETQVSGTCPYIRFKENPWIIEAMQFTGFDGSPDFVPQDLALFLENETISSEGDLLVIRTLKNDMRFRPGEWIIKGYKSGLWRGYFNPEIDSLAEFAKSLVDIIH